MNSYTQIELDVLKQHYPAGGVKAVQALIKRSPDSIRRTAMNHDIRRDPLFRHSRVDYDWLFDLDDPTACYCLGLLWGDGAVTYRPDTRSYACVLTLIRSDAQEVAPLFKGFVYRDKPAQDRRWQPQGTIRASSKALCEKLIRYGFKDKSHTDPTRLWGEMPKINRRYFVLGFLDADGHVGRTSLTFAGAHDVPWTFMRCFSRDRDIEWEIKRWVTKRGHRASQFVIQAAKDVTTVLGELYTDCRLGLSRKRASYESFVAKRRAWIDSKTSRFYGVCKNPSGTYRVTLSHDGVKYSFPPFKTELGAARARNAKIRALGLWGKIKSSQELI